jgi:predicted PurR-regulated permease PerM
LTEGLIAMPSDQRPDLIRNTLAICLIGVMLAASFWVLQPFLPALIWASMIVIATWPLLLGIQERLQNKRRPAVMLMIGILILVFVVPFSLAVGTIVEHVPQISAWGKNLATLNVPAPPDWVLNLPIVGKDLAGAWQHLIDAGPKELAARLAPHVRDLAGWLVAQAGSFGLLFVHFVLTLLLSAILYFNGEAAADMVSRFARRVAGERGVSTAVLAGRAIRAVALGVVVTALVQSIMAGLGLAVVGFPYATLLTALIFMLTIAQIGAGPVLIPAIIWLYWKGSPGWATALLVWSIIVMGLDNVLRPVLIRKGANLPLLLIFAGVIGGLIAFGLIGLFIGPVLLAVSYTLLVAWIAEESALSAAAPTPSDRAE